MASLNPERASASMPSPPSLNKRPISSIDDSEEQPARAVSGPATAAISNMQTSSSSVSFLTIDEAEDHHNDTKQQQALVTPAIPPPASYYEKGSVELAFETPVMMQRLEKRRRLTGTGANDGGDCLVIALVRTWIGNFGLEGIARLLYYSGLLTPAFVSSLLTLHA